MREVRPVLPPSEMPAPDSMWSVTGGRPKQAPTEMEAASQRKGGGVLEIAVAGHVSNKYRQVVLLPRKTRKGYGSTSMPFPSPPSYQRVDWIGWNVTTFRIYSHIASPHSVPGKYVTDVPWNQLSTDTSKIPNSIAPRTRNCKYTAIATSPKMPIHVVGDRICDPGSQFPAASSIHPCRVTSVASSSPPTSPMPAERCMPMTHR